MRALAQFADADLVAVRVAEIGTIECGHPVSGGTFVHRAEFDGLFIDLVDRCVVGSGQGGHDAIAAGGGFLVKGIADTDMTQGRGLTFT